MPDTKPTLPDSQLKVPDNQEKVPDNNPIVPDTRKKVPDSKLTVPDNQEKVPDTTHTPFALSHLLRVLFLCSLNYALFMVLYNRKSVENLHRYYA